MMFPYTLSDQNYNIIAASKYYLSDTYLNGDNEEKVFQSEDSGRMAYVCETDVFDIKKVIEDNNDIDIIDEEFKRKIGKMNKDTMINLNIESYLQKENDKINKLRINEELNENESNS